MRSIFRYPLSFTEEFLYYIIVRRFSQRWGTISDRKGAWGAQGWDRKSGWAALFAGCPGWHLSKYYRRLKGTSEYRRGCWYSVCVWGYSVWWSIPSCIPYLSWCNRYHFSVHCTVITDTLFLHWQHYFLQISSLPLFTLLISAVYQAS